MLSTTEIIDFLQGTKDRFGELCHKYNPGCVPEEKRFDSPMGPLQVVVSRGEVFEKASYSYCDLEIDTPPVLAEQMGEKVPKMRCICLEINLFPANPHVPKSYIELRINIAGRVVLAGGTDIFPYFPNRADSDFFGGCMKELCATHGQDYERLRQVRADFFQSKLRGQPVGSHAGIYFFSLEEVAFPFFQAMADTYFTSYEELVKRRNGEPVGREEKEHQRKLHGHWAQWIMLEDEGTLFGLKKGIPIDALLGAILPPAAEF